MWDTPNEKVSNETMHCNLLWIGQNSLISVRVTMLICVHSRKSIKTGQQSYGRRWLGLRDYMCFYIIIIKALHGWQCTVHILPLSGDQKTPGCTISRKQASGVQCDVLGNVLFGIIGNPFMWMLLWHIPSTQNTVADQLHPFMEVVFPDGSGLLAPCHPTQNV